MEKDYPNMDDAAERKTWQERNPDKYYYDRHYTSPEELLEINAREQRGRDDFHYDRHYTSPEELLEINAREQRGRDDFHYDRHYTSPEEYFGGPSDLTEQANERREEFVRKKIQREDAEKKFKDSQERRKDDERFQSLPMGQKLYEVVSFYGKSLARNPLTVEMSKRVFSVLSDFRSLNFTSMHVLFDELKNSNDETLQDAVPYWEELLVQCEEEVKKIETSKYIEAKEEYTKNNIFSKFIARFKNSNVKVDERGKKR